MTALLGPRGSQNPVVLRLTFAGLIWMTMLTGHIWFVAAHPTNDYDGMFVLGLIADLLPGATYALFIRGRGATVVCGALILLITAQTWFFAATQTSRAQLIPPLIAGVCAVGLSIGVAANEAMRRTSRD